MSVIDQIAQEFVECKGLWIKGKKLAAIQNRFGASIHLLRTGAYDMKHWEILRKHESGSWMYKFTGKYLEQYDTQSPRCCDCGSYNVKITDVRKLK